MRQVGKVVLIGTFLLPEELIPSCRWRETFKRVRELAIASCTARGENWRGAMLSRRSASGFFFSGVHAISFQVAVQAGTPNSQKLRGLQAVALAQVQHPPDVHLAHVIKQERFPIVFLQRTRAAVLQVFR